MSLPKMISTQKLAELFDLSPERLRQLTKAGVIEKVRHGEYNLADACQAYFKHLRVQLWGDEYLENANWYEGVIRELKAEIRELKAQLESRPPQ